MPLLEVQFSCPSCKHCIISPDASLKLSTPVVLSLCQTEGQWMEVADNMPVFHERCHIRDIHSCKVFEGAWLFYEHPNYRGRQYLLEHGEYCCYAEWGGMQPNVGSIRRVMEHNM
uniref:Beta/gamma crystallin 'Greek key' domain-containing protein n=1 Tax=Mola mola TaxID=94237 RepID=A0A3Q3W762_MOLML